MGMLRGAFLACALFLACSGCEVDRASAIPRGKSPPVHFSMLPVKGPIRRPEGEFGAPRKGGAKTHNGIDILARRGSPVRAVWPGIVAYNRMNGTETDGYGYTIIIDHMNDYYTLYAHLDSRPPLEEGEHVVAGEAIGEVGHTGNADSLPEGVRDMLHFEVIHAPSWMLHYLGIRIVDALSPKTVTTLKDVAEGNYGEGGGALNPLDFYRGRSLLTY